MKREKRKGGLTRRNAVWKRRGMNQKDVRFLMINLLFPNFPVQLMQFKMDAKTEEEIRVGLKTEEESRPMIPTLRAYTMYVPDEFIRSRRKKVDDHFESLRPKVETKPVGGGTEGTEGTTEGEVVLREGFMVMDTEE